LICGLIESKNSSEIGDGNNVFKEHIYKQTVTSFVAMHFPGPNTKDKHGEDDIFVLWHGAVVPSHII
jgi:hypothetical protein